MAESILEGPGRVGKRATARLAMKVGLDEGFRSLLVALAHAPSESELALIRRELEQAMDLFSSRGWTASPTSYHEAPPELEDSAVTRRKVGFLGSDYTHIRFDSGYEPHDGEPGRDRWLDYEENRTGHAWVLRHKGPPRPWLICIHGFRMGWPTADLTAFRAAWLHGALGLNVVIPTLPLHGQRKIGSRSGDGFLAGHIMDTVHGEAQAMWDLRRIISWIKGQGSADIGVYGVSLGGYTTALLATLEGELACAIAGMPAVCLPSLLEMHAPAALLRGSKESGIDWGLAKRVMSVVSPLAAAPVVPQERRYIFSGTGDRLVPPDHVSRLWRHWDSPKVHWYSGSHLSFALESGVSRFLHEAMHESGLLWAGRPAKAA